MKRQNNMAKTFAQATIGGVLVLLFGTVGIAQQTGDPPTNSASQLRIGPGDLIEVTMFDDPELSGHFRVDENGDVVIPLLGPVHVEGATAEEAAKQIEKRYVDADVLQPAESHATVFISEYATQGITVNGAVKAPGLYPALGIRMLNDLITSAGGELPTAASKVVIMRRSDPANPITVDYNPEALTPVVPRVQIFPGDSIMVPRAGIVYVMGNVARSGGYVLDGRQALTVEEAMGLAGGGGRAAALSRVQLLRTDDGGRKLEFIVPVNLIYKGKAPDVALKDGDILYVPTSHGKLITEQALTAMVSIGTSVAIYRTAIQ